MIKNALLALQIPYEVAIATLEKYSIKTIDEAISLTYQANTNNKIKTKPAHYFLGVLKQIDKDADL
ncbi:hypothetical protein [Francisella salimarina]|uniref:hypothetical protein n=1 Tax=Francisella salimarina TaxID=2599927 RepID=UPI003D81C302